MYMDECNEHQESTLNMLIIWLTIDQLELPWNRYVVQTYVRPEIVFTHAEGARMYDAHGKEYLDFAAGIAVNSLGAAHLRKHEATSFYWSYIIHRKRGRGGNMDTMKVSAKLQFVIEEVKNTCKACNAFQ